VKGILAEVFVQMKLPVPRDEIPRGYPVAALATSNPAGQLCGQAFQGPQSHVVRSHDGGRYWEGHRTREQIQKDLTADSIDSKMRHATASRSES
jgi:hypothetical protein